MSRTINVLVMVIVMVGVAAAQEQQQPAQVSGTGTTAGAQQTRRHQGTHQATARVRTETPKKEQQIPSIIESELERSRAEEKQVKSVAVMPAQQPAQAALLWPLFVSLGIGASATVALLFFFLRRKKKSIRSMQGAPSAMVQHHVPAPIVQQAPVPQAVYEPAEAYADERFDEQDVHSASPYINDDETEMPEAALTMNLLNKKRETKRELILEVMKRVQRRENPQHIAEALRIGIGEVHLAMTLAKLKK